MFIMSKALHVFAIHDVYVDMREINHLKHTSSSFNTETVFISPILFLCTKLDIRLSSASLFSHYITHLLPSLSPSI